MEDKNASKEYTIADMSPHEPRVLRRKLSDYIQNPDNPVGHNPRNLGAVLTSIERVGAFRSGAASKGKMLAGNLTLEAMAELGIEDVIEVTTDGKAWVIVNREDLTPDQEKFYSYADERSSELATWNPDQIAADLAEGLDLSPMFFDNELVSLGVEGIEGEAFDPYAEWEGMPEFEQEDAFGAIATVKVHFATLADIHTFANLIEQVVTERTKWIWFPKQERANLKAHVADES